MKRFSVWLLFAIGLCGCPGRNPRSDAGPIDTGTVDADFVDAGSVDAAIPLDAHVDPEDGTVVARPAEVVRIGEGGILLRGTVLAPDGPLENGEVLIVGDTIVCVAEDCSSLVSAGTVTIIETHATIAPGLIDAHNHLSYNFLPEWVPSDMRLFGNRYEWRGNAEYRAHVEPEARLESWGTGDPRNRQHMCAALRWGELQAIVHGTTTMMGQCPNRTCIHGLMRNAEHHHQLGTNRMRTTISGACETTLNDSARVALVNAFRSGTATRHMVHMAEGTAGGGVATDPTRELDCYAGRYRATTSLLYDEDGSPYRAGVFIHAVPFTQADLEEAAMAGVHFVWSPSSNLVLYGRTAPIQQMLEMNLPVALGPDWTVSGSDDLLTEMHFALDWALAEQIPRVSPEVLVRMATEKGASAVDLADSIGRLAPGLRADVVVFGRTGADPYEAVTDSRAEDVRLVMIDGVAYYGDMNLEESTAANPLCETIDACGTPKFLCAAGTTAEATVGAETVDEIELLLRGYLDGGWSGGAFMLNGTDLTPLIDCGL